MVQYSRPPVCENIRDFKKCNTVIKDLFSIRYDLMRVADNLTLIKDRIRRLKQNSISLGKKGGVYNKILKLRDLRQKIDNLQNIIAKDIKVNNKIPEPVVTDIFYSFELGKSMARLSGISEEQIREKLISAPQDNKFLEEYYKEKGLEAPKRKFGQMLIQYEPDMSGGEGRVTDIKVPAIKKNIYSDLEKQIETERTQPSIFEKSSLKLRENDKDYYSKLFGRALMNKLFKEAQSIRTENMYYEIQRDSSSDALEVAAVNERHNIRQQEEAVEVYRYLQELAIESFTRNVKDIFFELKKHKIVDPKTLKNLIDFTNAYASYLKGITSLENKFDFLSVNTLITRISKQKNVRVEVAMDEERKLIEQEIRRQENSKEEWYKYQTQLKEIKSLLNSPAITTVETGLNRFQTLPQFLPKTIPGSREKAGENKRRREIISRQIAAVKAAIAKPGITRKKKVVGMDFIENAKLALMGIGGTSKLPDMFRDINIESEIEKQKSELETVKVAKQVKKAEREQEKIKKEVRGFSTFEEFTYLTFAAAFQSRILDLIPQYANTEPKKEIAEDSISITSFYGVIEAKLTDIYYQLNRKEGKGATKTIKQYQQFAQNEIDSNKRKYENRMISELNTLMKWKKWPFLQPTFYNETKTNFGKTRKRSPKAIGRQRRSHKKNRKSRSQSSRSKSKRSKKKKTKRRRKSLIRARKSW